jgi:hypothetical protein
VDAGALHIEHCPTEDVLADFFKKPLQGSLFRRMRDRIMNIDPSSPYHSSHRSVLEHEDDLADQTASVGGQADSEQANRGNSQSDLAEKPPDSRKKGDVRGLDGEGDVRELDSEGMKIGMGTGR